MIPAIQMLLLMLSTYWVKIDIAMVLIGIFVWVFGDQYAALFWVSLSLAVIASVAAFLMKDFRIE